MYCITNPLEISDQPSIATNKINLTGIEIVTGLIIIIPSANRILEITQSTTTKGK